MRYRRLLWQIYLPYLLIIFVSLLAVSSYASHSLRRFYLERTATSLEARAVLAREILAARLSPVHRDWIEETVKKLGRATETRLTVVLPSGLVLGDSDEDPKVMDNHATRPEIAIALGGEIGRSARFSHTLQRSMMYVAVPVVRGGTVHGVIRASLALTAIEEALARVYQRVAASGAVIAVLAAGISLFVTRRISRPLEDLRHAAERFALGDLSVRLPLAGSEEIAGLSQAMNRMASELQARLQTVVHQRNEQEAVLSSMLEGVIAVDRGQRVITMNRAAAELFGLDPTTVIGHPVGAIAETIDLHSFIRRVVKSEAALEDDLTLHGDKSRYLQAHGAPVRDANGERIGVVVVLNDVTRLRRLETVRRDFVANVSHELKTPITSIKGFVETLIEGAVDNPEHARRFLTILARQADRLNAIIEDLLSLSRIEQEAEEHGVALAQGMLRPVLEGAMEICRAAATDRGIVLTLACPQGLQARVNAPLLEQAVVNLVDNAVKYSDTASTVEVSVRQNHGETIIAVRDRGCGIEASHLPRLFERFYRVDKARSRKLGGTGLGLAIVKHIAQAHGGTVRVVSIPGRGSTFSIRLPGA